MNRESSVIHFDKFVRFTIRVETRRWSFFASFRSFGSKREFEYTATTYRALLWISSRTKSVMRRAHSTPPRGGARALCFPSLLSGRSYRSGASSLSQVLIGRMSNASPMPNRPHLRISSFNNSHRIVGSFCGCLGLSVHSAAIRWEW